MAVKATTSPARLMLLSRLFFLNWRWFTFKKFLTRPGRKSFDPPGVNTRFSSLSMAPRSPRFFTASSKAASSESPCCNSTSIASRRCTSSSSAKPSLIWGCLRRLLRQALIFWSRCMAGYLAVEGLMAHKASITSFMLLQLAFSCSKLAFPASVMA